MKNSFQQSFCLCIFFSQDDNPENEVGHLEKSKNSWKEFLTVDLQAALTFAFDRYEPHTHTWLPFRSHMCHVGAEGGFSQSTQAANSMAVWTPASSGAVSSIYPERHAVCRKMMDSPAKLSPILKWDWCYTPVILLGLLIKVKFNKRHQVPGPITQDQN